MSGATFDTLLSLDAKLETKGFPPLSAWWREQSRRFYAHATAHAWAGRIGRGGAKSTTGAKVALNETLFGEWTIPPGERHYAVIVSENREEASGRLRLLEAYLRALGIAFTRSGDVIDLVDMPRGFRVCSCRVGGVSGYRVFFMLADELAKWGAFDEGADPPAEVLASARAMMVTHARSGARSLLFSSPLAMHDAHFRAVERGDTADQVVSIAPSWTANPEAITEAETRAIEPDERIWRREYLAIPQLGALAAFDQVTIDSAFRSLPVECVPAEPVIICDPSNARGNDAWTWAVVGWTVREIEFETVHDPIYKPNRAWLRQQYGDDGSDDIIGWKQRLDRDGRPIPNPAWRPDQVREVLHVREIGAIEGEYAARVPIQRIVEQAIAAGRRHGATQAHGDQRDERPIGALFGERGMPYTSHAWGNENKRVAVETIRLWFREKKIVIEENEAMRRELAMFEEKITPGGYIGYGARGRAHDDRVALLLTAAIADSKNLLAMSPHVVRRRRGMIRRWPGV